MAFPLRKNYKELSDRERVTYAAKVQVAAETVHKKHRMDYSPHDLLTLQTYLHGKGETPSGHLLRQIESGVFDSIDWGRRLNHLSRAGAETINRLHGRFLDQKWEEIIRSAPKPDCFKHEATNWLDHYVKNRAPISPYGKAVEEKMLLVTSYGHPDMPAPEHLFELPPILAFGALPPVGPLEFEEVVEEWEIPMALSVYGNIVIGLTEEYAQILHSVFRGEGQRVWRLQVKASAPPPPQAPMQAVTPAPQQPTHPLTGPVGAGASGGGFRTISPAKKP
jgi:hypothetical protein